MNNQLSNNSAVSREAKYKPTGISRYDNNPLIEALTPIMTDMQAYQWLAYFPVFDEMIRNCEDNFRQHYLRTELQFFAPLNHHIDLHRRISYSLRTSYLNRNPIAEKCFLDINKKVEKFDSDWQDQYNLPNRLKSTNASGFNFVGTSGTGKTQALDRSLSSVPQIISHSYYKKIEFNENQLTYLRLECPFDGSIKGLCINFFQTVDAILGTNYHKHYGTGRRTTNEMIPSIARIAANHHLGIFVIDEIQRLNSASSGGKRSMLNFFVQLVNTIGVSVILVGTYSALDVFKGNFSQLRRGTGQGDVIWDRMIYDSQEWNDFSEALWQYQIVKNPIPFKQSKDLLKTIYEESQGITDLAIKVFTFAQERAVETGLEKLTPTVIRSSAKDKLKIIRPAIHALKTNNKEALLKYEDVYPEFLEKFMRETERVTNSLDSSLFISGKIASEPEFEAIMSEKETAKSESKKKTKENYIE